MRKITLILALLCAPVAALEVVDGKLVLSAHDTATLTRCAQEGGCAILTRAQVEGYILQSIQGVVLEASELIKQAETSCRKPSI